ncbi:MULTISPECIES: hemagglutinin repeat-containing protein [Haloarcula]|jgi:hypothetical protein|uniref:hemagglutinin repeat-containing protein n=1 Tax=Haloarcula TaxID=2237 RepID=UPI00032398E6|nr:MULTISPECIES: hemagglutinin repeat-containing protein [Haloarcula]
MLRTDTRAQSIQIGAVLLFGVLIVLLSTWQAFGIPNQNEGIEFNHNQKVQQQMTELRTTVTSMPDASVPRSVTLDLGVRYPSRALFRNPPPAPGTVRTVDTGREAYAINITGSPVDENLAQLWNETDTRYNTGAIKYSPLYSEYQNPPQTIYEHSVVFNKFQREDTSLAISGQSIIQGDRITLVFLNGSLSETQAGSTSVDFEPMSTQTRTVTIEPTDGNVTLDIPTRLAVAEWRELLGANHEVTSLANIPGETDPFASDEQIRTIRVKVDANRGGGVRDSYRLQLAKVGVGADVTQPDPVYLTEIAGNQSEVDQGDTMDLTVEVRDEYNDPKRGVTVQATATGGTANVTSPSDEDGRVEIEYTAPSLGGKETVTVERDLNGNGTIEAYERVQFTVNVASSTSGTGDSTAPQFTSGPTANPESIPQGSSFDLTATLDDIGRGGTDIISVTWADNQGNSGELLPSDGEFDQPKESVENTIDTSGWSSGDHTVTVTAKDANGNTRSEDVTVTIQPGASLPFNAVAFNDQDGDGVYDSSEELYTESEAAQLDTSVDLVVENDITANKVDISTRSVKLKSGVTLSTNNELKLDVSERIDLGGGTLDSGNKITLKSSSSGIDAQGATLESKNEMKLTADDGDLNLIDADMNSENKVTLSASGEVNAQGATIESKNEMKITANGGDMNLSGSALTSDNKITLISSADIDLRDTELQAKNQIKATPASAGTLFVNNNDGTRADGGTYIEDQNENKGEIRLQQGSVSGTPEKGDVTQ